jgi:hypothetical protein
MEKGGNAGAALRGDAGLWKEAANEIPEIRGFTSYLLL